jgi:hypothetical protein
MADYVVTQRLVLGAEAVFLADEAQVCVYTVVMVTLA